MTTITASTMPWMHCLPLDVLPRPARGLLFRDRRHAHALARATTRTGAAWGAPGAEQALAQTSTITSAISPLHTMKPSHALRRLPFGEGSGVGTGPSPGKGHSLPGHTGREASASTNVIVLPRARRPPNGRRQGGVDGRCIFRGSEPPCTRAG